ncbi:MAG: GTP cyclohydrolase [Verrucomicrobia bacterium]|nr:GTP cyclohydrolase [Verrucomicrobiota bacterium]MCH8510268.1 GTP cyclohydrolase [Kiritimatiellia bacterium]
MNEPTLETIESISTGTPDEVVLDFDKIPAWLKDYFHHASKLSKGDWIDHPMHGTTVYLAETEVPTRYGLYRACIFQDIIHKGYVIALTFGDVRNAEVLHTRMHSSCVTSETLGGCDCDCVQQLEGAMAKIAEKGKGVLFYLLQEGRGVGYSAKARDRMLVQASGDTISTFEAYRLLGLKKDYRQYLNIADIVHILGIDAEWVVLTNNPDKVAAMNRNGMKVKRMESLEFEPGPFNLFYLKSKQDSGHKLTQPNESPMDRVEWPEPVTPFKPRRLEKAQRFIYMASYMLPIRPIDDEIVMPYDTVVNLLGETGLSEFTVGMNPPILRYESLRGNRLKLKVNSQEIKQRLKTNPSDPLGRLLLEPYWFRVHVYFDIVSGDDFVVLTHGTPKSYERPIVRIQSESILDRFPVNDDDNQVKYQKAIQHIVRYGSGAVVLVYQDGRGAGFGAYAVDRMMMEQGHSLDTRQSYERLGIPFDQRDYGCLFEVLKSHLPSTNIQMVMNSPNSLVTKNEYALALHQSGLNVENWIFLESE